MQNLVYRLIRLNRVVSSHRVKFLAALLAHTLGMRHLYVQIDPVWACNVRCRMCYFSNPGSIDGLGRKFTRQELERIAALFYPKALRVVIGCGAEPTLHRDCLWLLQHARESGVPNVTLVTNGQLTSAEDALSIVRAGVDEIIISAHGVTAETYEELMTGASHDKLLDTLRHLDEARQSQGSKTPGIRMNYTVCDQNLQELSRFFEVYGRFSLATLQVRAMKPWGGEISESGLGNFLKSYREITSGLKAECEKRGVTLMAVIDDPTYSQASSSGLIIEAVRRWITPMRVWQDDFNWVEETYTEYCRRIGWKRQLTARVLSRKSELVAAGTFTTNARDDILT